jgi:DNA-binding NarL/FixJ family response regulator
MPALTKRARLLVADDHSLVAAGIRSMLEPKYDVVGMAGSGRMLVRAAEQLKPDVILLDISMPELNGIEAARQILKAEPRSKIIFVTMYADATFVTEAMRIGACGYVLKRAAPQELVTAIEQVLRGRIYLSPLVTKDMLTSLLGNRGLDGPFGALTPRQREILQLVAEGRTAKEIGAALHISLKTVEFHKSRLMRALGLQTSADVVKYAIRHGIVSV